MRPTGLLVQAAAASASPTTKMIRGRIIGPDNKELGTRVKRTTSNNAASSFGDPVGAITHLCRAASRSVSATIPRAVVSGWLDTRHQHVDDFAARTHTGEA